MIFVDSHLHLYAEEFDSDRKAVIERAMEQGVKYFLLPNIDSESVGSMLSLAAEYESACFPMMGLHPTSVKEDYRKEWDFIASQFQAGKYAGVGECGIDLYWDKTFLTEQEWVFKEHIALADELNLPLVIHQRQSFYEIIRLIKSMSRKNLTGVFHCFTGSREEAAEILKLGFKMGIGGVLTYKNAKLGEVLQHVPLSELILETDAPYLPPVPHRGRRNEPAYIPLIAARLAEVYGTSVEQIAGETTRNAKQLFGIQ